MSGYIGTQPVPQATQTRDSFTATSGQTSFATGGYTPNFLDVYLNGVKLAAADYTATNGSDVVLASGAATGDILEVVAYTTFTVGSSFTPSIDDNGNATAITIDSSENVLIGMTTDAANTVGIRARGEGLLTATRDGSQSAIFGRKTSDGDIALFQKDGTTVGSIATYGGDLIVGTGDTRLRFVDSLDSFLPVSNSTGSSRDAGIDLGHSETRYKDIYTSGGIYLGAASNSTPVAANYLDDYEEGTWTPSVNVAITGTGSRVGKYTKVGRLVTATCSMTYTGLTGSTVAISNLPFTNGSVRQACVQGFFGGADSDSINGIVVESSDTRFYVYPAGSYSGATLTAHFSVAYQVD